MFEKVIFVPDPRTYRSRTIGVDDTAERLKRISIQLGSKSGKWVKDASNSAILERRDDGFYELLLHDLEQGRFEVYKIFDDPTAPKEVCREVERMFERDEIIAHKKEGKRKPYLIPNNQ